MSESKRVWVWLVLLAATTLAGCPRAITCPTGEILENNQCYADCRVRAPPCWSSERMVVVREDGGVDGATDSSDASGPEIGTDVPDAPTDVGSCSMGQTYCAGRCVDASNDPLNCGACAMACPAAAGERAVCAMGACSTECVAGFERNGTACQVRVPRLVRPMSTSYVSSQRPTLRWEAPMGVDGAVVEVCSARDCATVVQRGVVTGGATSWRVETALSAGVYWWRAKGRVGTSEGARTSATWEFIVGARDRVTDTNWGTMTDVNGDGFGDLVVGDTRTTNSVLVFHGSASGPVRSAATVIPSAAGEGLGSSVGSAGDVNGDGYGDVILGAPLARNAAMVATGSAVVVLGGASGLTTTMIRVFGEAANDEFGAAVSAAGDVDGDGYGDVIVGAPGASASGASRAGRVYVFRGGPAGIVTTASRVLEGSVRDGEFGRALAGAIDGEADGFADVAIGAPLANDESEGQARVGYVRYYRGGMAGLSSTPTRQWVRLDMMGFPQDGARWGTSVSAGGDINGDGYGDFVFGGADPTNKRAAFWVAGGAGGVAMMPTSITVGVASDRAVGHVVAGAGDVDGDGFDDVLISRASGNLSISSYFRGSGPGLAATPTSEEGTTRAYGVVRGLLCLDVNRDNRAEMLVSWQVVRGICPSDGVCADSVSGYSAGVLTAPAQFDLNWGLLR